MLFTLAAVVAFYCSEFVESKVAGGGQVSAFDLVRDPQCLSGDCRRCRLHSADSRRRRRHQVASDGTGVCLQDVESAADHMEPEDLANALMGGSRDLLLIDVPPADEFEAFHIPGAVNVQLPDLSRLPGDSRAHGRVSCSTPTE